MKLNPQKLGTAFGLAWGLLMFFLGLMGALFNWGIELIEIMKSLYKGYTPTFLGSFLGTIWGFISGYLWGFIIAVSYNNL
ncbi:MAG: bacteriophage holin [Candidatus Magasanikbacteria bacterium]